MQLPITLKYIRSTIFLKNSFTISDSNQNGIFKYRNVNVLQISISDINVIKYIVGCISGYN